MSRDQDTTIASARASINRDIEKHLAALHALKQQLNRLAPISSLPPEIMTNIFSFVRDVSLQPLHWIKVTHVCTYWRQVAVHAPGLWCRPPLANRRWTVEMLARSKQVDITLENDGQMYYAGQYEGYEEAFQHAARIRHISLDFSSPTLEDWLPAIMGNLPLSAPRLETLLIKNDPLHEDEHFSIPGNALVDVPNLRRLELTGCGPNWDAHWLPQITHLKICNITDPEQLTRACLMTALRKMHNLESLILFDLCPSDTVTLDEWDQAPLTNIHLVRLRLLSIWDKFSVVESFFRYVTFSPEAAVNVFFFPDEELPLDLVAEGVCFATTLRNIAKSYSNTASSNLAFKSLVVDFPGKTESQIRFGMFNGIFEAGADLFGQSANLPWEVKSAHCGLTLVFGSLKSASASWYNVIFPGIFSAGFPLDNISHAHLRSRFPLEENLETPRLLAKTIGVLPELSFIKVSILAGPWILRAAVWHTSEDVGAEPVLSSTPFPRLESIHFHGVPFLPSNTTRKNALGFVDRELLKQFLVTRSDTVRRCQLEGCFSLTTADVDELCEVVGDVVCWDGVELDEHDYEP